MDTGALELEVLGEAECLALLRSNEVGRMAIVAEGHPLVCPVRYTVDGNSIIVRTNWTILARASLSSVALEIDGVDAAGGCGWSVLVQGVAHDVTNALDLTSEHLRTVAISPWAPGSEPRLLRLVVRDIRGQRFGGGASDETGS